MLPSGFLIRTIWRTVEVSVGKRREFSSTFFSPPIATPWRNGIRQMTIQRRYKQNQGLLTLGYTAHPVLATEMGAGGD